jgi:hypothetical protein
MDRTVKEIIVSIIIFVVVMVVATIGYPHEHGHAEGIYHLIKGERSGRIEKSEWCWAGDVRQNKIVLSIDEDMDNVVEECFTLWYEHGTLHYILSDPDENGKCECEGYLWFDKDSQGEKLWDSYEDLKLPHSD